MNFNFELPSTFVFFFLQNSLIESCLFFEGLSAYKISWSHVNLLKYYAHFRRLKVRHFGKNEATRLNVLLGGHHQRRDLSTKYDKNLLLGSKVNSGGTQTDEQTAW
jgi:hypothetical protein